MATAAAAAAKPSPFVPKGKGATSLPAVVQQFSLRSQPTPKIAGTSRTFAHLHMQAHTALHQSLVAITVTDPDPDPDPDPNPDSDPKN